MDAVNTLHLNKDYLARLIVKVQGLQAQSAEVDVASGSNPADEDMRSALEAAPDDLTRREIIAEIAGLNDRQQAELVALMWIGREDAEPEEWDQTIELARSLKDQPTPQYLLRHPLVANEWLAGAERLGIDLPMGD